MSKLFLSITFITACLISNITSADSSSLGGAAGEKHRAQVDVVPSFRNSDASPQLNTDTDNYVSESALEHQNIASDDTKLDVYACSKEGYDYAKMVRRQFVEHGGCWCKTPPCNYSSMCEGIANKKKRACLIDKGWTSQAIQAVAP